MSVICPDLFDTKIMLKILAFKINIFLSKLQPWSYVEKSKLGDNNTNKHICSIHNKNHKHSGFSIYTCTIYGVLRYIIKTFERIEARLSFLLLFAIIRHATSISKLGKW